MARYSKGLLTAFLVLVVSLLTTSAQACIDLWTENVSRLMDMYPAAFRGRVMQATLRSLSDLGIACETENVNRVCDVVELKVEILEDFKSSAKPYTTIYTPVFVTCRGSISPGQEYVFFLEDIDGLYWPGENSFMAYGEESEEKVVKLRDWKAAQPH